jgi:hypothetical protein
VADLLDGKPELFGTVKRAEHVAEVLSHMCFVYKDPDANVSRIPSQACSDLDRPVGCTRSVLFRAYRQDVCEAPPENI